MKLIAIDMDGTCLNSHSLISEQTLTVLREASKHGLLIVPTTGRSLSCLPHQLKKEYFYDYVISSNGGTVTDIKTGQDLYSAKINNVKAIELLERCQNLKIGLGMHAEHEFLLQGRVLKVAGYLSYGKDAANAQTVKSLISYLKQTKYAVEEFQFIFEPKKLCSLKNTLNTFTGLNAAYSSNYVEIYDECCSKGNALKYLADYLKIDYQDIVVFGDSENDLSMFKIAGTKYAMGNAIPELKNHADRVLPSNDEDGVAYGIKQLFE